MFGTQEATVCSAPNMDSVRQRLSEIMARLRSAGEAPLSEQEKQRFAVILPQIASWLPDTEKAEATDDISAELQKLALMAA